MKITEQDKKKIAAAAKKYVERYESQNQAATTLQGVSGATLSHVLQNKWEQISDKMWRTLISALSYKPDEELTVMTRPYKTMMHLFVDAKENSLTMGIVAEAGTGKTFTIKSFEEFHRNVFVLQCREYWNRKWFLQDLLTKIGRPHHGMTIAEMMQEAVRRLMVMERPIIIMDEYDKLPDHVLSFFITMYNELEDRCGFVVIATNHLKKRIIGGVQLNKKGYNEIYSRLGRRFIEVPKNSSEDISMICMANGIKERGHIKEVIEESEWDLRRVKRKMHAIKAKMNKAEDNDNQ
jgi:DNA transposition AAA+ family ATPase